MRSEGILRGDCNRDHARRGLREAAFNMTGETAEPEIANGTGTGAGPPGIHSMHAWSLKSRE
jgi:hypothetical protein